MTTKKQVFTTIAVERGDIITGVYKTPGRPKQTVTLEVEAVVKTDRREYVIGTPLSGMDWAGSRVALKPQCFWASTLEVSKGTADLRPLPENLFVFASYSASFGMMEEVEDEDVAEAEIQGGVRIETLLVPFAEMKQL